MLLLEWQRLLLLLLLLEWLLLLWLLLVGQWLLVLPLLLLQLLLVELLLLLLLVLLWRSSFRQNSCAVHIHCIGQHGPWMLLLLLLWQAWLCSRETLYPGSPIRWAAYATRTPGPELLISDKSIRPRVIRHPAIAILRLYESR